MPLSKEERESLTRQLFEAVATVGFLTWKAQYGETAEEALALFTPEQLRQHYSREIEKTAWPEIQEMARTSPDDRLTATLADWRKRATAMQRDADYRTIPPKAKARDIDMERG